MAPKRGLGRGLDNLIPTGDSKTSRADSGAVSPKVKTEIKEVIKERLKRAIEKYNLEE